METIIEPISDILNAFDGESNIVAIDLTNCPNKAQFKEATQANAGELWVSKDLSTFTAPAHQQGMSKDITQTDLINGREKLRVYRRLDQMYFIWLYCSVLRAKKSPYVSPDLWQLMAQQFNVIWTTAIKWQGWEGLAKIKANPFAYIDDSYIPPQADAETLRRFNARNN